MARKKKSSPIGDIYELVALLPWWLGVILAIASYLLLRSYASQGIAPVAGAAPVPLSHTVGKALAAVFQYILPIVCLAGAVASAWERYVAGNCSIQLLLTLLPPAYSGDRDR